MLSERLLVGESDGPLGTAILGGPLCFFEGMLYGEAPAIVIRCPRRMITKTVVVAFVTAGYSMCGLRRSWVGQ